MAKRALLSNLAIAILLLAELSDSPIWEQGSLCYGRQYPLHRVSNGASPYIELSTGGVSGQFLLDYGTTVSILSRSAFATLREESRSSPSFAGVKQAHFVIRPIDMPLQPAGNQVGTIGTNFLSVLSIQIAGNKAYVGSEPCPSDALRVAGLVPIAQRGFFSSNPAMIDSNHPNVPIVFLQLGEVHTFAQIDTGYEDIIYPHSLDINEALFKQLVAAGIDLDHLANIRVSTCQGAEIRPVYTVRNRPLVIETERASPILRVDRFHLVLKPANGCGGIGAMSVPAAQLGASFLQLFETVIFDPQSGAVWFKA
jgi:hypothetical protein